MRTRSSVAPAHLPRQPTDMDTIFPLLLLSAASSVVSEPLSAAIQRRSGAGVYASDYSTYQPVTFVAIPLHKPVPVLHILSQTPLLNKRRSPAYSHSYRTDHRNYAYSTNHHYVERPPPHFNHAVSTNTQRFYNSPVYASGMTQSWYSEPRPSQSATESPEPLEAKPMVLLADTDTTNDDPVILYARPNPNGGYSYRKKPPKKVSRPKKKEPVIIRIHKYRVVRDD